MIEENQLLLKDEVCQVTDCAMEVLNTIGGGFHEKPYKNVLVVEMQLQGIPYKQQCRYPIVYESVTVGEYIPDRL